ncbi:MAG: CBS domain-containing protein [Lachnospiraceae bacterium]|nr:CBS domain-containing protein [Lachnospiraceae bacterium]
MYVKDHMTKEPLTITRDTVISKALEIMRKNDFHRLPVVDENGKIVGLVTGGLVEEESGSRSTSLSIYELNYLLSKTAVESIMIKNVLTITQDVILEEAAQVMIDNDISCLPVVDESQKVIGIITEKDIFQAFNDVLGYRHQGTRFVISCEDRPGYFIGIAQLFAQNDANLESIALYHTEARGTEVVVKATGEIETGKMTRILVRAGYNVTDVVQTTRQGGTLRFSVPKFVD